MSLTAFAIPTVPEYEVEAVYIGPTWQRDADGDFVLPERTLGWQILTWISQYLNGPAGGPFKPTKEQTRFLLWWYAVDDEGRFVYRDGILQRLKGWGKDPLVAVICLVEMLGPCRFDYFTDEDMDDLGLMAGDPVGKENPAAWVQVAAVSEKQTKNTMLLFGSLISKKLMVEHGMTKLDIGKQTIYAYRGSRQIEAVTSSPRALEGGRPTFVVRNETHHWIEANGGHEMADVIERNATKSAGGQARALSITNAYDPSEGSVAQVQREAWEAEQTGEYVDTNVLYDSIEAPEGISMRPPEAAAEWKLPPATPEEREYREACVRAWLAAVLTAVRGDAVWLDIPSITNAILSQRNGAAASTARRFWFNNIVAAEDRWADPPAIEAGIHSLLRHARATEGDADQLRLGWIVDPDDPIVMFFDGSKNDDSTVLVGTRIDDGYTFVIGVWSKPRGDAGKGWEVPREEVNARVVEAFERFTIVAFWADPSHTLEDDNTRFWDRYIDRWHQAYKDQLQNWPVLTGNRVSSIMWDMTDRVRTSQFVAACEIVRSDIHARDILGDYAPTFFHDGHPALRAHLRNAHENPGPDGISVRKKNRSSNNKIDLAVALIGAQMLRRVVMNAGVEEQKSSGGGWVTAL